jgi:hypothetical protein
MESTATAPNHTTSAKRSLLWRIGVHLNKSTEIAIDRDDREIIRFLCRFSSKNGIDVGIHISG